MERLAVRRQQIGERPAGDQLAQHRLGRAAHHARRVVHLEQVDARVADRVADRRLHLDEVAVAGHHHRFVGNAAEAVVAVRLDQLRTSACRPIGAALRKPTSTVTMRSG